MKPVYEMRIYTAAPGKLEALLARFANHTEALFQRYSIKTIGYWVPLDNTKNQLLYIVEHASVEAAEKNWDAFRKDPDWQKLKKETDADVPLAASIERYFMDKVDFSQFQTGVSSKA